MGGRISAIIPAFNEETTIGSVVRALIRTKLFEEVIVVDDGSNDLTSVRSREAGATVYRFSHNQGKSTAMRFGVKKAKTPLVCFVDADLIGLRKEHLESIIGPVVRGDAGMCVGLRDRGRFFTSLMKFLPLIGGERALRREIFEGIPVRYMHGFRGELMLNARARQLGYKIATRPLRGLHIRRKMQKVGFIRGLWQYARMGLQLLHATIQIRLAQNGKSH